MTLSEKLHALAAFDDHVAEVASADDGSAYTNNAISFQEGARWQHARLTPLLTALIEVACALVAEPIEVVGKTKDGRPNHKWTRHERVAKALAALKDVGCG